MRILYLLMIGLLLFSFWKAMWKLRQREARLTPILGWMLGLGFFIVAPLTIIVLLGGYEIPSFHRRILSAGCGDMGVFVVFVFDRNSAHSCRAKSRTEN
jgi:hypothetical protein